MGTVNLLEVLRQLTRKVVVVNVTSDKCYLNQEWVYSYRESDALGGYDPYSSSKACSEILTEAFRRSFFPAERYGVTHQVSLASGRAGNVIGGGDWAMDRLIPDCVRSVTRGEPIIIRSPDAIRPWQHVLEPLAGYLWLGVAMASQPERISGGWNFGPLDSSVVTVRKVVEAFISCWGSGKYDVSAAEHLHEAGLLKLDISKAIHQLEWKPVLKFDEAIQWTTAWYRQFHDGESKTLAGFTRNQIQEYTESARLQSVAWAGG
jgi:CDP-glucose 4,6-dehydratase